MIWVLPVTRPAVPVMLISVLGYSGLPLAAALLGASSAPFLFTGFFRLGVLSGYLALLAAVYGRTVLAPGVIPLVLRRFPDLRVLAAVLSYSAIIPFSLALRFVDPAVAAFGYETSSIMLILVVSGTHRRRGDYLRLSWGVLLLALISFLGFGLVVLSESGGWDAASFLLCRTALGVALSLLSGVMVAFNGFIFTWTRDLSADLGVLLGSPLHPFLCWVLSVLPAHGLLVLAALMAGLFLEDPSALAPWPLLSLAGMLFYTTGGALWFLANVLGRSPSINALGYLVPSVGLLWLVLFSQTSVARPDWLILGVIVILGGNLGIAVLERR